jgi:hypothetical protein
MSLAQPSVRVDSDRSSPPGRRSVLRSMYRETSERITTLSKCVVWWRALVATLARGESVIKYKSPLNVLKDAYDYSCCLARSYEYNHLMTDPPGARPLGSGVPGC